MAIGRSIYYKERSWNDFHFYSSEILSGGVKIIQPSVYHEQRGEISTTYHSEYYDRLIPLKEREKGVEFPDQEKIKESVKKDPKSYYELNQDVIDQAITALDENDSNESQMVSRIKKIFGLLVPNGGSAMEKSGSRGAFSLVNN